MPIKVNPPAEKLDPGRKAYYSRRGQMNLACAHCHEQNWGKHLGAETLSQGQPNGYPAYRLEWQRSEEHTSELQSRPHLVCRLLLEKKKNDGRSNAFVQLTHHCR